MKPLSLLVFALLPACRDGACPIDAGINPGCGVLLDGEPLRLGDALDEVRAAFGEPSLLDLGGSGQRFDLASAAGFCDEAGVVRSLLLLEGFPGETTGGVGPGSARSAVESEFGAATPDPLTGGGWYGAAGIGFEFDGGAVSRIHVFPSQAGW